MIYKTERLLIRKLLPTDIEPFYKMRSNINVMKYTDTPIKTYTESIKDLYKFIRFYDKPNNDFWVYAIERNKDNAFLGIIALIKDDSKNDEIAYCFLEKHWNNGYATESMKGALSYYKKIGVKHVIAEVYAENKVSEHIIKKEGFKLVKEYLCQDSKLLERIYKLKL